MASDPSTTEYPTTDTIQEVERLLDDLGHVPWPHIPEQARALAAAEEELQAMGMQGAYAIQCIFRSTAQRQREQNRAGMRLLRWTPLLLLLLVLPLLLTKVVIGVFFSMTEAILILSAVLWYLRDTMWRAMSLKYRTRLNRAVRCITRLQDKRTIPILMDMQILVDNLASGDEARQALTRLLPALTESDAALLSREHRERLNRILSARGRIDLTNGTLIEPAYLIAIVQALSQVGDASSLPAIERFARSRHPSPVRDAARDCLPVLRGRIAAQSQTLLRPSGPTMQTAELLRPAAENPASATEELLRAAAENPASATEELLRASQDARGRE